MQDWRKHQSIHCRRNNQSYFHNDQDSGNIMHNNKRYLNKATFNTPSGQVGWGTGNAIPGDWDFEITNISANPSAISTMGKVLLFLKIHLKCNRHVKNF